LEVSKRDLQLPTLTFPAAGSGEFPLKPVNIDYGTRAEGAGWILPAIAVGSVGDVTDIEVYAAYRVETLSKLVLDSGATKSCGSILAVLEYQRMMMRKTGTDGVRCYDQSITTTFRFGHGKTLKSLGVATIQASVHCTTVF
jgi:hypothetical protein